MAAPPRAALGWLGVLVALASVAAWQLHLAFSPPPIPGAPLPLVGGGEQPDWAGTVWTWWWVGEAVRAGANPLVASGTFFPVGQRPLAWFNLLDAFTFAPLLHGLGPRVGYNLSCGVLLTTVGLSGVALGRAVGLPVAAAALIGLALQTSPFVTTELLQGRAGQAWIALPVLAFVALVETLRPERRPHRWIGAGVLVALSGYLYWFYGLFVGMGAAAMALVAAPPPGVERRVARAGVAGAVAIVLVAPAAVAIASGWDLQPGVVGAADPVVAAEPLARGQQSLAFAIRTAHWPGWPVWDAPGDLTDKRLHPVILGLCLIGLAVRPRVALPGGRRAWLAVAALGWVLTLGPYLRGLHGVHPIPLPWLWLHDVAPLFSRLWWPERAELLVWVGVSGLASAGLAWGLARVPGGRRGRLASLVALAALLIGLRARPLPAGPAPTIDPELYGPLDGALVTVPVMGDDDHGRKLLWAQTHHGRPILAGLGDHLPGHRPPGYEAFVRDNGLLAGLHALSVGSTAPATVSPDDVAALREAGFRWVVFDAHAARPGLERRWAAAWTRALTPVLGVPDVRRPGGLAWRLDPLDGPAVMPAQDAVEAGIIDQQLAPLHRGGPPPGGRPPPRRPR